MERIAIYGKGGSGKTMLATAVSRLLAGRGLRVLHVGCDPKRDSSLRLAGTRPRVTMMDAVAAGRPETAFVASRDGVDCVEAGGPPAGTGCAGRGILITLDVFDRMGVLTDGRYDAVVFDVLGDVVCGGFAAPLRSDDPTKVVIVLSDEPMSLFAANNITRMVQTHAPTGVVLAGLVLNRPSDPGAGAGVVDRFAALLGTTVLARLPRDAAVVEAERARRTVVDHAPTAAFAESLRQLVDRVTSLDPSRILPPTPLDDETLESFLWGPET